MATPVTQEEYLHESFLGEQEYSRGNLTAAIARFTTLLERIKAGPEGMPLGPGSFENSITLHWLARCLTGTGQVAPAYERLQEALPIIAALLSQKPDQQAFILEQSNLLTDLGDALRDQGQYAQAREKYEEGLKVAEQQENRRGQAVALGQLGTLALRQQDYAEAQARFASARDLFQELWEPGMEAIAWHQLGRVAEAQVDMVEAERCYRKCIAIVGKENPVSPAHAAYLNSLAVLMISDGWKAGYGPDLKSRLVEAKAYAERALTIRERLDVPAEIWITLGVLAVIAEREGKTEAARAYRQREREAYAVFPGNRLHLEQQHRPLITGVVVAAQGSEQAQVAVEKTLPDLETQGWRVSSAIRGIWAGQREWQPLVEDLDPQDALLVLLILETLASPAFSPESTPEQLIDALPPAIQEALHRQDEPALEQAFVALSAEERQAVATTLASLQARIEAAQAAQASTEGDVLQEAEPMLQAIAAIAAGDTSQRRKIEELLADLETKGWHLRKAAERIWTGEREATALTAELDAQDTALVQRVLEIIALQ